MKPVIGKVKFMEKNIHKQIIYYLKQMNYFAFHIANEVNYSGVSNKENIKFFVERRTMGVVAGVPDICVCLNNGVTIWLEVKGTSTTLSANQKEFHEKLTSLGHKVFIVKSVEDVIAILNDYKNK